MIDLKVLLLLAGAVLLDPHAWADSVSSHKVVVRNPAVGAQIAAQGGRLIADYGSSQLYEVQQLSPVLAATPQAEVHDEYNFILLNAARLDTRRAEVKALHKPAGSFAGKRMHLVQFAGPVQPAWRQALAASGVQIVDYLPYNAYLVYGDAQSLAKLQGLAPTISGIQWEAPFAEAYKIHPAAEPVDRKGHPRAIGTDEFAVQLVADPPINQQTLRLLNQLKLAPFAKEQAVLHYIDVVVRLSPGSLARVASQPDVISIQPYFPRRKLCERQDQIVAGNLSGNIPSGPGYLAWLGSKGFTQAQFNSSGFVVDVSDSGIDNGTTSPNHLGLHQGGVLTNPSRVVYNRLEGTPNSGSTLAGCDGHGNLNAHIVGGDNSLSGFPHTDSAGYHYGLGVCPFVKLGSSVIFDPDSFTNPNYDDLEADAYQSGARISNNSWGGTGVGAYDIDAQSYDALVRDAQRAGSTHPAPGNQEMVIVFAAGNEGVDSSGNPVAQSIDSPGTAKNVITVGAGEDVQAFGGTDGSGVPDTQADSANDVIDFSSRGPCADGRHKPELMAPASHVSGGAPQAANPGPDGTANPCFLSDWTSGVSGGPNNTPFWPSGQQFYTASSGSSHSTPCVSGGCALVRQFFISHFTNPASPAMTKAYLVNSARYMTGAFANDTLWSDTQGMGEMNLGMAFDGIPRIVRDQVPADLFTASGQVRVFTGTVSDSTKPFRVTLAWTDAPGSTAANAYNNDLDLTVTVGGNTYKGNVFTGALSATGGVADSVNNVESVFLPAGLSGSFTVTVTAANINSDGVPNNSFPLDQDFALVVYNGNSTSVPVLAPDGTTLLNESCTNGAIDPGETVTLNFALQNLGSASTTNLVATLLPGGGVVSPSAAQSYGAIPAAGGVAAEPFTFTAQGSCGGVITATLQLRDGSANLGNITFTLQLGSPVAFTALSQNFDSVTPPALPAGWTSVISGGATPWATSSGASATPHNSAFGGDVANPGIANLVSPVVAIQSAFAQLTFQNAYDLEADTTSGTAYDGGVLEIKIGSGPFQDILAAGGSFVTGGYNMTIYLSTDSPLPNRQAWSGISGGFITTTVNLPAAAQGQNVQFRWRLATDTGNQNGGTGWYVDSVSVRDYSYNCCTAPLPPTISGVSLAGAHVTITFNSIAGVHYTLQYKNAPTDPQWSTIPPTVTGTGGILSLTDTNSLPPSRFYRVMGY
ncbi:MAG TPA: S8 family serine peptidase [Verrucomicrobiae bacterium]|nr:S8 family serine peptidase [Verrucomicrobiae bacterium]